MMLMQTHPGHFHMHAPGLMGIQLMCHCLSISAAHSKIAKA